jgi:hypothetical protein
VYFCDFCIFVEVREVGFADFSTTGLQLGLQTPDSIGILRKNQEKKFRTSKSENLQGKLSGKNLWSNRFSDFSDFFQ